MNNLLMFFMFVPMLALLLLALNLFLAPHNPDEAKISPYESGFLAMTDQTRSTFQIHFYVVCLLFMIFDLEILLLFPIGVTLYEVSIYGFSMAIIFFLILTMGFILEMGSGAISLTNLNNNKN